MTPAIKAAEKAKIPFRVHEYSHDPNADSYGLEAAEALGVEPARAVVIEDAISGVAAGRAGGFALVVGIDHHGDTTALRENGADIVIESLLELLFEPQP